MAKGATNWQEWHRHYDDPGSSLAGRLRVVQRDLRRALTEAPRSAGGRLRLVAMCAGEGRDVLPVLAEAGDRHVSAVLVEFDPDLAEIARRTAAELGLTTVEVRVADAGDPATYADLPPAHILMACGVFGNLTMADARRTVAALPWLVADDGLVIWTRGHVGDGDRDRAQDLRSWFADDGFDEVAFTGPDDANFRVGIHRLRSRRLFTFT